MHRNLQTPAESIIRATDCTHIPDYRGNNDLRNVCLKSRIVPVSFSRGFKSITEIPIQELEAGVASNELWRTAVGDTSDQGM